MLFIVFACWYHIGQAQIINIESKRISTDTTGFDGSLGVSFSASKFTESFVAAEALGHVQYKTQKDLFLLMGEFQILSAGGEDFNNSGFGHLRYNRKFSDIVRGELFTQVQYNSVTKIELRQLNGIGLRLKLSPYENAKVYWGVAYMYEYEELLNPDITNRDHRMSTYFSFTLAPVKTITMKNTTYVQPLFADFMDYRLANNTRLNFGITKNLSFVTTFSFLYDSRPPVEVPNVNYQVNNGLKFNF